MLTLLLVEDERLFAKSVTRRLRGENYQVISVETLADARNALKDRQVEIVLLDVRLPDGNGLDFLAEIRRDNEQISVIMMTAYGELNDAVSAMKLGATDYLKKPVDLDELSLTLTKVVKAGKLQQQLDYSHIRDQQINDNKLMVGDSEEIYAIGHQLQQIASLLEKTTDKPPVVLLRGETGTGKDVAARFYHQASSWSEKPFVHVDCASLSGDLIEAELFGYERGAFTDAHQAKAGLIEVAEGGSLFLDEVAELPLTLQAKLLNVLERRVVRRLGSTKELTVSAHFIAATNRDLQQMVAQGTFRSDLYYRLNILEIELPPLRRRGEDILLLINHFINTLSRRYGLAPATISADALSALQRYSWPGNIRELQHVLERAVMLCKQGEIDVKTLLLPGEYSTASDSSTLPMLENMTLEQIEKYMIEFVLNRCNGNVSQAARELGLSRMAMRYRMDKYFP